VTLFIDSEDRIMPFADQKQNEARNCESPDGTFQDPRRPLHRIGSARRNQGLSLRAVASRMNTTVADVRSQESDDADLQLSTLYRWCEVLQVPIEELLVEPNETFSTPILKRVQMIQLLKTAMNISETTRNDGVRRLVKMLIDQMTEVMPELAQLRTRLPAPDKSAERPPGRIALEPLPDSLFGEDR
jgi:transcriptional regulator with XRE-family HTH domain